MTVEERDNEQKKEEKEKEKLRKKKDQAKQKAKPTVTTVPLIQPSLSSLFNKISENQLANKRESKKINDDDQQEEISSDDEEVSQTDDFTFLNSKDAEEEEEEEEVEDARNAIESPRPAPRKRLLTVNLNDIVVPDSNKRRKRKVDKKAGKGKGIRLVRPTKKKEVAVHTNQKVDHNKRVSENPGQSLIASTPGKVRCQACVTEFNCDHTTVSRHINGVQHSNVNLPKYFENQKIAASNVQYFQKNKLPPGCGKTLSAEICAERYHVVQTFAVAGVPMSMILLPHSDLKPYFILPSLLFILFQSSFFNFFKKTHSHRQD